MVVSRISEPSTVFMFFLKLEGLQQGEHRMSGSNVFFGYLYLVPHLTIALLLFKHAVATKTISWLRIQYLHEWGVGFPNNYSSTHHILT